MMGEDRAVLMTFANGHSCRAMYRADGELEVEPIGMSIERAWVAAWMKLCIEQAETYEVYLKALKQSEKGKRSTTPYDVLE